MYKIISTLLLVFIVSMAKSQITIDILPSSLNDSTFVVPYGSTDSFSLPNYKYQRFYVCDNGVLILKGTTSSAFVKIYLEPSAKVILKDPYFYPTIYMRTGAMLDAFGGMQMISLHRESIAYVTDTANVNFMYDSVHTSITYTYSGWPGGNKPCSTVSSINSVAEDFIQSISNQNQFVYYSFHSEGKTELEVYDLAGKRISHYSIYKQEGKIDLGSIFPGLYVLKFIRNGLVHSTKIQVQ